MIIRINDHSVGWTMGGLNCFGFHFSFSRSNQEIGAIASYQVNYLLLLSHFWMSPLKHLMMMLVLSLLKKVKLLLVVLKGGLYLVAGHEARHDVYRDWEHDRAEQTSLVNFYFLLTSSCCSPRKCC